MRSTKTSATGVDFDGHNEESHNGMEIKDNIDTVDNDDEATRYKKRKLTLDENFVLPVSVQFYEKCRNRGKLLLQQLF